MVVQPLCIGYEFFLLKLSQQQHMKRFSAFLGLPSATLRIMATRQVQVCCLWCLEATEGVQAACVCIGTYAHTPALLPLPVLACVPLLLV